MARAQQVLRRQQWTADGHTAGPRQAYRVCPAGAQQALGSGQIDSAGPEWMKVKEESEKAGIKLNIQKMKIMASGPITSWQIVGETMETVDRKSVV